MKYSGSELLHGPLCKSVFESNSGIGNRGKRERTVGRQVRVRAIHEGMRIQRRGEKEGDSMSHRNMKCIQTLVLKLVKALCPVT
jgi:hypothetical protein